MKRLIYIIVLILFSYSSHADRSDDATSKIKPRGYQYKLVMSKDDKVCKHMLNLYNDDIKKYGYEKYEHEEFKRIPWQEARFSFENHGRIEYTSVQGALFDFNNDGVADFVVRFKSSLGGRRADSLNILDSKAAERANELTVEELRDSKNKISLAGSFYHLQPPFKVIGGVRILEPFIYEGISYLYMRSLFDVPLAIGEHEYSVIARFRSGRFVNRDLSGKMEDVCYFQHVRNVRRVQD